MRIGVLGVGLIGRMHARNFAQAAGVDEVVLIGRDRGRLEGARGALADALRTGAPAELAGALAPQGESAEVTVGRSLDDELAGLDGLVVATSTSTHPEFALLSAGAGVPALVEKPLATDPVALTELADRIDDTHTPVMVAFHRRYDPAHQELQRALAAGEAGTIRAVTATGHDHHPLRPEYIPLSGGLWLDMCIHDFDTIPWVTGQRVRSVWAAGAVLEAPAHAAHDDVDSGLAALVLDSGAVATVSGLRGNGAGQDVRLEVFGSRNTLGAGIDARTPITSTEPGAPPPAPPYDVFVDRFERAFRSEADAFVRLVDGTGANLTPPRAGLHALQIALAADESLRTGARIDLD